MMNEKDGDNDELICPITLELFHDPVLASDGHVYEREVITKWILQHGTSPLTRQTLRIDDLQTDERRKNLARQRRISSVSYQTHNEQITPNSRRIAPLNIENPIRMNHPSNNYCWTKVLVIFLARAIPVSVIIAIYLFVTDLQNEVESIYSGTLISNSSRFIRSTSPDVIQPYYNAIQINIYQDGIYRFQSQSQIDLYAYLYLNSFDSTNINSNLLISDDNSGGNSQFYFQYFLSSHSNYILVVTTRDNNTVGSYRVSVKGPSFVNFN